MARLARFAYLTPVQRRDSTLPAGVNTITHLSCADTDTQFDLARLASGAVVVVFRGSSSLQDWLTDLNAEKVQVKPGLRVHQGFNTALQSVLVQIITRLRQLQQREEIPHLYLTGHSLGGALAQLCALWLSFDGFPVTAVYTFGSPRVGNGGFARLYQSRLGERTWRVVNCEDPVPRLLMLTFRHAGNEVFLNQARELRLNPSIDHKLISDLIGVIKGWFLKKKPALLPDHFVENYVRLAEFNREVFA